MPPIPEWAPAAEPPPLEANDVHIWRLQLDRDAGTIASLADLLSVDEREKADRYYFPHLRTRYIAGRGALRLLLGRYAGEDPAGLSFAYAQHGKPFLSGSSLRFNVSHSNALGLVAVALHREIGVDLELVRSLPDQDRIARRFFSAAETADYLAAAPADRDRAFYACWTRKEAYIKAIGDGLTFPLDRFRVSVAAGEPARLLSVEDNPAEAQRWTMLDLDPAPGYAAALIAEGRGWEVGCYEFV